MAENEIVTARLKAVSFAIRFQILTVFFIWLQGITSSVHWFVSRLNGTKTSDCGQQHSRPCKFIYQAATRAHGGDVINIDGSGTTRDPYPCESAETSLQTAGFAIQAYGSLAFIACENNSLRFSCDVTNNSYGRISVTGITFVNTSLYLIDCSIKMTEVAFVNSSVDALSVSVTRGSPAKIELVGCIFQKNSADGVKIFGHSVYLDILNSTFVSNRLRNISKALLLMSSQNLQAQFNVNVTNITVIDNECPGEACFKFGTGNNANLTIKIKEGKFERNHAELGSVLNVRGTSIIQFMSVHFRNNKGRAVKIRGRNSLQLKVVDGNFIENKIDNIRRHSMEGGAVSVGGFTKEVLVFMSRSNFGSNEGEYGGACAFLNISWLTLNIESCRFYHNKAWSSGGALTVGTNFNWLDKAVINIYNSNFSGNKLHQVLLFYNNSGSSNGSNPFITEQEGGGALALHVSHMWNLKLINNTFANNKAREMKAGAITANIGTLHQEAVVLNCEFLQNFGRLKSGSFELNVSGSHNLSQPRVTIQNSRFIRNKGDKLATYDVFVNHNFLLISFCKFQQNSGGGIFLGVSSGTCDIRVENSIISDNKNFAFAVNSGKCSGVRFKLTNVSITNNTCDEKSSIFHVSMHPNKSSLNLQASRFEDNFCKSGVAQISVATLPSVPFMNPDIAVNSVATLPVMLRDIAVIIKGTVFRENSGVTKSTLTVKGCSAVSILNSTFENNFGHTDGSHVRVKLASSELKIYNTKFYQSEKSQVLHTKTERPYSGFLTVISYGNVTMRETSFTSDPFSFYGGLIFVEGAGSVSMDNSVRIQSPFGSKLYFHNFSHWETFKTADQTRITSFSFVYQACPIGTYSVRRGASQGFKIDRNYKNRVKCLPCPKGANCTSTLAARPNFWGYPIGEKISFTLCPHGYCCPASNQKCPYRNNNYLHSGCQGHRTGILCGRCKENFTEALFHNNCHPVKACRTNPLYLLVIFLCPILFALYLIHKPPLFQKLMTNLTWFVPSPRRKDYEDFGNPENENKIHDSSSVSSEGFLKILFYFYQIAELLTISSYGVGELLRYHFMLPLISLMDFKLFTSNNNWNICPFPGITPLSKTLSQLVIVMALYLSILLIYLLHSGLNKLCKRTPVLPQSGPYLGATLEALLLGYSATTGSATKLLNCKTIQHVSRWFYNAEVTCYQWWQWASVATIAPHLLPFIFMLYDGSLRLHRRQISGKMFLLACVFPLLYLLLVFLVYLRKVILRPHDNQEMTSQLSSADPQEDRTEFSSCTIEASVLDALSAPFYKPEPDKQSPSKIYWESILIGRRFILILIGTFVAHAFLRSVLLAVTCLIFLLHHLSQKPFVQFRANLTETVSLTTLVVIAILNVGVDSYFAAGIEAANDVEHYYVKAFLLTEAILLSIVPVVFVTFVSLCLASQLVRVLIIFIQFARRLVTRSKDRAEEVSLLTDRR